MKTRPLGSTGVSVIGLGSAPLAIENRQTEAETNRVIHAALDAGMNWIDTADAYSWDTDDTGYGERIVARALRDWSGPRAEVHIVTKAGYIRPRGDWVLDGRPSHIAAACEASLKALGVSSLYLYQLHGPDPKVYFPDSIGAMAELQRQGKIRHIGLSNVDVPHIREALKVAPIVSVQNRCSPHDRRSFANGVVEMCEKAGIAFIAYSPVGGQDRRGRIASDPTLKAVGARLGRSPQQVALAWLLERSPAMLLIPGASRVENALSSAAAADIVLTPRDRAELDSAFRNASSVMKKLVRAGREARYLGRSLQVRAMAMRSPHTA
jgi:aryl-alcohol dehydrogenase-like predicted oxidoreductase